MAIQTIGVGATANDNTGDTLRLAFQKVNANFSDVTTSLSGKQNTLTNPITGTGTTNYLSKFTGASSLGNSLIYDNGTNVGIGTTSPTDFGGTYTNLDVFGTNAMVISRNSSGLFGQMNAAGNDALYLGTRSNHNVNLTANNSNVLTLTTSGNVGIGTTSPGQKLDVNGGVGTALGTGGVYLSGDGSPDIGYIGYNYSNVNGTESVLFSNRSSWRQHFGNGTTNQWKLAYRAANAANGAFTDYLTVNNSGNVGIGTTAPGQKLDVNGDISSGGTGINGSLKLKRTSDGVVINEISYVSATDELRLNNGSGSGNITFLTTSTERMRITSGGNVGIGTFAPTSKLHVSGLSEYATNAAAITGGLTAGAFYHTAGVLKVVI